MQGAIVGGTLNVKNSDRTQHRTRFLDARRSIRAVVRQSDAGQVVPLPGVLEHPGIIEIRCDLHPWTRGWIMVYEHPYFVLTDRTGSFEIDSIPSGRYRLVAWHARLGRSEQDVDVKPGESLRIQIQF
ncbi:MAG: carboxypeptidase regulatory-like domain-containing protein [Gemmatimonadaceae bacterium]